MRCYNCPCCGKCHYPESNVVDYYCELGKEDEQSENKNGDLGCNINYKKAEKMHKVYAEEDTKAFVEDCKTFLEYIESEKTSDYRKEDE